jgi:plastocyanin
MKMTTGRRQGIVGAAVLPLVVLAIAALLLGCGHESSQYGGKSESGTQTKSTTTPAADTSSSPSSDKVTINLAAKNIAFDMSKITVPAGAMVTINFDNKDEGIPHNFAVYKTQKAADQIFSGQIITGPKTITYTFKAPDTPGNYFFRCDVHPERMTGTFVVQ